MPPPKTVDPAEAMRILLDSASEPKVEESSVEGASGRVLAQAVSVPVDPRSKLPWAAVDGLALRARASFGAELQLPADAERVECGDELDSEIQLVLPVRSVTYLADDRVRVDEEIDLGFGVVFPPVDVDPLSVPAGSVVTPRLRSLLLARGVESVSVVVRPQVSILSIGDDLLGRSPVRDVVSPWIERELSEAGVPTRSLGVVPDEPEEIERALLRARAREDDVVIWVGSSGDGLNDRAPEALRRFRSRIYFERVATDPQMSLLYARTRKIEIFGLSGVPSFAAAAWAVWIRTAVLRRIGVRETGTPWWRSHAASTAPGGAWGVSFRGPEGTPDVPIVASFDPAGIDTSHVVISTPNDNVSPPTAWRLPFDRVDCALDASRRVDLGS